MGQEDLHDPTRHQARFQLLDEAVVPWDRMSRFQKLIRTLCMVELEAVHGSHTKRLYGPGENALKGHDLDCVYLSVANPESKYRILTESGLQTDEYSQAHH